MTESDSSEITATHPPLPPPPAPTNQGAVVPDWQPQVKSPVLAVFLGTVFLGHFYVGAFQRAVVFVTSFCLAIYLLPTVGMKIIIPIFIWFWNLFDVYRLAQLANLADQQALPEEGKSGKGTLMFGVFLTVVGTILLIDRFIPINLEWMRTWWPVLLLGAGIYFIVSAIREQMDRSSGTTAAETTPDETTPDETTPDETAAAEDDLSEEG